MAVAIDRGGDNTICDCASHFFWVQDHSRSIPDSMIPLPGLCATWTYNGSSTSGRFGEGLLLVDGSHVSKLWWALKDFLWFLRDRRVKVSPS